MDEIKHENRDQGHQELVGRSQEQMATRSREPATAFDQVFAEEKKLTLIADTLSEHSREERVKVTEVVEVRKRTLEYWRVKK